MIGGFLCLCLGERRRYGRVTTLASLHTLIALPAAAAAGRAIMAFVLELDAQIAWKLNKTTIEFRA